MAGEYRLPEVLARMNPALAEPIRKGDLRIALTSVPIVGHVCRSDLTEALAAEYERIGETKYSNGLRNGSMIPIAINHTLLRMDGQRQYGSGELFFKS